MFNSPLLRRLYLLLQSRRINIFLVLLAILSCGATYWTLTKIAGTQEKTSQILPFIYLDVGLLLLLGIGIGSKLIGVWSEYRRGVTGAKLHIQLVVVFSLLSIVPAGMVAIFSSLLFNVGVKSWFSKPVKTAIQEAGEVAEAYLREHQKMIKNDVLGMVLSLRPRVGSLVEDSELFTKILNLEAESRNLGEILVFDGHAQIIGRSYLTFALGFEKILASDFQKARAGEVVIHSMADRVRALVQLDPITDTYLFIGKFADQDVLQYLKRTKEAIIDYHLLENQSSDVQVTFMVFLIVLSLLLLLIAAWLGLSLANILFSPVSHLIEAAEAVSQGDLSVEIIQNPLNNEMDNLILAFNNMTKRLQQQGEEIAFSQKKAAWADIARKIAHEIKNPLTPIQLSAERLKRKYLKEIKSDPETFKGCIDTIVRQVNNIGALVTEFSAFARMPEPKINKEDIVLLCQHSIELQKQAYPNITFELNASALSIYWNCDEQQIQQVLTNILQNSINAITENVIDQPKIIVSIILKESSLLIIIEDNGLGFPKENRARLLEPYYTTREKGTGLGLAIVSKIVDDHGGKVKFLDSITLGGAKVVLEFSKL